MLHIFIGCSSLHQPLALLSEVAVSTITIASGVSKSVSAVTAIAVVGIGVRRTLAVSVAQTAIAVAQTAVAVSGVSTTIAIVSIGLRVGRPLAIAAISVAQTAIAIAQTAVAVSGVGATVAIVSVRLR